MYTIISVIYYYVPKSEVYTMVHGTQTAALQCNIILKTSSKLIILAVAGSIKTMSTNVTRFRNHKYYMTRVYFPVEMSFFLVFFFYLFFNNKIDTDRVSSSSSSLVRRYEIPLRNSPHRDVLYFKPHDIIFVSNFGARPRFVKKRNK